MPPLSRRRPLAFLLAGAWVVAALALAPRRGAAEPALTVTAAGHSYALSLAEFQALPHVELTAYDPHGKMAHRYSGVPVHDLLSKVGMPSGEALRGAALRQAVVIRAGDGYATLFALAEFDENFSDRILLLADLQDGQPLPEGAGPLRLIAPGDKRAARWARRVKSLEIVSLPGGTS